MLRKKTIDTSLHDLNDINLCSHVSEKPNLALSIRSKAGEKEIQTKNHTKFESPKNRHLQQRNKPCNNGRRQTVKNNVINKHEEDSFKTDSESDDSEDYDRTPSKLKALKSSSVAIENRRQSINSMLASNFKIERFHTLQTRKTDKENEDKHQDMPKMKAKCNQINFGNIYEFKRSIYEKE